MIDPYHWVLSASPALIKPIELNPPGKCTHLLLPLLNPVQNSMMEAELRCEPLATTAAKTPAAIYEYPSMLDKHAVK